MKAIENFIIEAANEFGGGSELTEEQVKSIVKKVGRSGFGVGHIKQSKMYQDGKFTLPVDVPTIPKQVVPQPEVVQEQSQTVVNLVATNMEKQNLVPSKFEGFVPWGHFKDIKQIVKSGIFYPVFVTGLSGNGKTLMIEQVHSEMKKELIRVNITIEQPYPANSVEKKIVMGSMTKYGAVDEDFATNLVTWSEVIRKSFFDGGVDELISTRRLDHIAKSFSIFKDKQKSIELCVARFDEDTKVSFLDLYSKIDAGVNPLEEEVPAEETSENEEPQF